MNEVCENARDFLGELIGDLGFDISIEAEFNDDGCLLNLSGDDVHFALSENGEMLDAFETILFQLYGRELEREHRITCDAEGFRLTRQAELHAMANFAALKVREKGIPFTFGLLNSTERRMIHLALKDEEDVVSESVGMGRDRRLQVRPK